MNCDDCLVFTFQSVFLLPSKKKFLHTSSGNSAFKYFKFLTRLEDGRDKTVNLELKGNH